MNVVKSLQMINYLHFWFCCSLRYLLVNIVVKVCLINVCCLIFSKTFFLYLSCVLQKFFKCSQTLFHACFEYFNNSFSSFIISQLFINVYTSFDEPLWTPHSPKTFLNCSLTWIHEFLLWTVYCLFLNNWIHPSLRKFMIYWTSSE